MGNPSNATKVVAIPFTLEELDLLKAAMRHTVCSYECSSQHEGELFRQLEKTVNHYFKLATKDPDSLPAVSMLNAEYQEWAEQLEAAMMSARKKMSTPLPGVLETDPRQLEIPLRGVEDDDG